MLALVPKSEFSGHFIRPGAPPTACTVTVLGDDLLRIEPTPTGTEPVRLYIEHKQARYCLGHWLARAAGFCRPRRYDPWIQELTVEASALVRIHSILQSTVLSLQLQDQTGLPIGTAETQVVSSELASPLFLLRVRTSAELPSDSKDLFCSFELRGLRYYFKTHILDQSDGIFALSLPQTATRTLQRGVFREDVAIQTRITSEVSKNTYDGTISNISPLGACVQLPSGASSADIHVWNQIWLRLGETTEWQGLVVSKGSSTVHIAFAADDRTLKSRFLSTMKALEPALLIHENAQDTWSALEKYGYLALLNTEQSGSIREKTVQTWAERQDEYWNFLPVVYSGNEVLGTIGVTKVSENHWIPHLLATNTEPDYLEASAFLYAAWPTYLLCDARPLWFSTWYDSKKAWHNRFYQVFIKEHAASPDVQSYVRKLFWTPDTGKAALSSALSLASLSSLAEKEKVQLTCCWQERYKGFNSQLPLIALTDSEFEDFRWSTLALSADNEPIGVVRVLLSRGTYNPMAMFNIGHIHLFDEKHRMNSQTWTNACDAVLNWASAQGIGMFSLTLDYDAPVSTGTRAGLQFISDSRCLAATDAMLPGLISNNTLCFKDIEARKRKCG